MRLKETVFEKERKSCNWTISRIRWAKVRFYEPFHSSGNSSSSLLFPRPVWHKILPPTSISFTQVDRSFSAQQSLMFWHRFQRALSFFFRKSTHERTRKKEKNDTLILDYYLQLLLQDQSQKSSLLERNNSMKFQPWNWRCYSVVWVSCNRVEYLCNLRSPSLRV